MANSTDAPTQRSDLYPPSAFHFKLVFANAPGGDASFQEVSGIGSEIDVQEVVEGGENRYVHRLPKGVKHPLLSLKRGIAGIKSPLVIWCKSVLEAGFIVPIVPQPLLVFLLDENLSPLRGWSFANAYPVKWEIESFNSTKNEVAIETIDLSYNYSNRIV
jgi:phage tail-like protein